MTTPYLAVPTRIGMDGAKDKAAIANGLAYWTAATNREFLQKVRTVVNNEKSAEGQIKAWFKYCEGKTYSREVGDIFSHPNDTDKVGGDCDDTLILLLAGIKALGVQCEPEVITRNDSGIHIRLRVGMPPHSPPADHTKWKILDPSHKSELLWVGATDSLYSPRTVSTSEGFTGNNINVKSLSGLGATTQLNNESNDEKKFEIGAVLALLAIAAVGFGIRIHHKNH